MKKIISLCLALAYCLTLTACQAPSLVGQNVEDFLRAPEGDGVQSAIQKALTSYLGETMQLKYPRGGSEMTPIILHDFDMDGTEEAAVLYTTQSKGKNVHLAMMENIDATWEVAYEIEGLAAEVESVQTAAITQDALGLVISYAGSTLTDKYLAVYDYRDETVTRLLEQSYSRYILSQFASDGTNELMIISRGALSLQLAGMVSGEYKVRQIIPLNESFTSCEGLYAGQSAHGDGVVVDGLLAAGALASAYFSYENGVLIQREKIADDGEELINSTRRFQQSLLSCDIDGDGSIEVPRVTATVNTLATTRRFYYVNWQDFSLADPAKSSGLYDALYGYYVRLPEDWPSRLTLVDDSTFDGNWQLLDQDGNTYLSARIASPSSTLGAYKQVGMLEDKRLLLYFADKCTVYDQNFIMQGVKVL